MMMNRKRFSWKTEKLQHLDDEVIMVVDNANKEWKGHILNIVDKLNELNDERMMYITTIDKRIVELEEENMELQKQLNKKNTMDMQLREINKKLGDDLHNCRLNKNIIAEKLKLWQDVHKEYGIYSINDFEELMKNDK